MAIKAEGIWTCTVLGANYGENPKKPGVTGVQINVKIDEGPSKGVCCTYEDEVNARSALYIGRSCRAVGWKGGPSGDDLDTLRADVDAWIKATGGKSTIEIKHITIGQGKRKGEIWDKPNSVGRGPKPLAAPSTTAATDARDAMRRAMQDDGVSAPDSHTGGAPPDDVPPVSDEDIPFLTCGHREPSQIAKVLR